MFGVDDLAIAGLVMGGVSSIANFGLGLANYGYQKNLQNDIFRREDTSIARRVHDLKASGLSPVLAAGQGAGTGGIVSTRPPEIDPSLAAQLYTQLATMQKDFAVKDKQIEVLQSQKDLNDITSRTKRWDLAQYIKSGTASNASGLAKTIRDLWGMSESPIVKTVVKTVDDKIRGVLGEMPSDYKPGFNKDSGKNYKKLNPKQREIHKQKLWDNLKNLQN